ncbi:MAG: hypothetical protein HKN76_15295 [Saprospiraceae bacterium]|nr:hypothetical protein [Saprospiraceae bacterium]
MINPAAPGFNDAGSDAEAIVIADQVMEAMGGREAWDETQIISWNFFGRRHLVWNKETGQVRIDIPADTAVYLLDLQSKTIRAEVKGEEIVNQDSLGKHFKKAEGMWINDSYWLVMPFKLKDSGVTLKYVGRDSTQNGTDSDVLQLTFDDVGNTPNNMYHVWVDRSDHLVKQWAFYAQYDQEKPPAIWPWDNYQTYGKIKISADRSDGRGPKFVQVFEQVDQGTFTDFSQPSFLKF